MGFKEDLEARRQREEAKRYFRSNNPYFFSSEMWMKLIVVGLAIALGCGFAYGLFVMLIKFQFSYVLALVGVTIAKTLRKIAGVGNEKLGILTVILYIISIIFSSVSSSTLVWMSMGGSILAIFNPTLWFAGFMSIFSGNILSSVIYLMGAIYAYNYASQ